MGLPCAERPECPNDGRLKHGQRHRSFRHHCSAPAVWNIVAGFAHLVQFLLIVVLSTDFSLPVTASYLAGPPGTPIGDPVVLFDLPLAGSSSLLLPVSLFHFIVASPWFFDRYARGLGERHNYFRWVGTH